MTESLPVDKVVHMSGDPVEDLQSRGLEKEAVLLPNPFARNEMAVTVRCILDGCRRILTE